jgi:hypothetical protein
LGADEVGLSNSAAKLERHRAKHATIAGLPKQAHAMGHPDRKAKLHSHHHPVHPR